MLDKHIIQMLLTFKKMYDINIIKKYNLIYVLLFKKKVVMDENILFYA